MADPYERLFRRPRNPLRSGSGGAGLDDPADLSVDDSDSSSSSDEEAAAWLASLHSRPIADDGPTADGRPRKGALRRVWEGASSPLRALSGVTSTSLVHLLGLRAMFPETYKKAAEELEVEEAGRVGPEFLRGAASLPGVGDLAAAAVPDEFKTSTAGRIIMPVGRLALNIAGDPTTYAGGLGAVTKVGRLGSIIGKLQRGADAAIEAGRAGEAAEIMAKLPAAAGALAEAAGAESAVGRGARRVLETVDALGRPGATGEALARMRAAPSFRTAGRAAATLPFSPLTGAAYAPELVEGIEAGVGQTAEEVKAGRYAEAAASGAGALLTAGLAALVGKGVIDEATAAQALERDLARQLGDRPKPTAAAAPAGSAMPTRVGAIEPGTLTPPPAPTPGVAPGAPPAPTAGAPPAPPIPPPSVAGTQIPPGSASPALNLEPTPGSERIQVAKTDENVQKLTSIVEDRAKAGTPLTKADLVAAGLVSRKQAKDYSMAQLLDALGGTQLRSRLEAVSGGGYRVKAGEVAGAGQAAQPTSYQAVAPASDAATPITAPTTPASAVPPTAAAPKLTTAEIDRQLAESPELRAQVDQALDVVVQSSGRPLQKLSRVDIAAAFPGNDHKTTRALLNRALGARQKIERETAATAGQDQPQASLVVPGEARQPFRTKADEEKSNAAGIPPHRVLDTLAAEEKAAEEAAMPAGSLIRNHADYLEARTNLEQVETTLKQYPQLEEELGDLRSALTDQLRDAEERGMHLERSGPAERSAPAQPRLPDEPEVEAAFEAGTVPREVDIPRRDSRTGVIDTRPGIVPEAGAVPPRTRPDHVKNLRDSIVRHLDTAGISTEAFERRSQELLGKSYTDATPGELGLLLELAEKAPAKFGGTKPYDPQLSEAAVRRLVGGTEKVEELSHRGSTFLYDPASPAGKIQREMRGMAEADDLIQNELVRWTSNLQRPDERHLSAAFTRAQRTLLEASEAAEKLEGEGKVDEARAIMDAAEAKSQKQMAGGKRSFDSARNLRRLLLDETDEPAARTELTKLLGMSVRNRKKDIDKGTQGVRNASMEAIVAKSATSGLNEVEAKRMSIREDDAEALPREAPADPGPAPSRPANTPAPQWAAEVRATPDTLAHYQGELAHLAYQIKTTKRTGTKGEQNPYMQRLHRMANDLGVKFDPRRGADRLIKKMGRLLKGEPQGALTSLGPKYEKGLEPGLQPGFVRVYRGQRSVPPGSMPGWSEADTRGRYFTGNLAAAKRYAVHGKDKGVVTFVDLPKDVARNLADKEFLPQANFILPDEWMKQARDVSTLDPDARIAVTDLLTNATVAQRGPAWERAVSRGTTVGDTGLRVVDFEGDAPELVRGMAEAGIPIGPVLAKTIEDIANITEQPSRFGGFAVSPQLSGLRMTNGSIYANVLQARHEALSQLVGSKLEGDKLAAAVDYNTAQNLVNTLIHEVAHFKAKHDAATKDVAFTRAYTDAIKALGPTYAEMIRNIRDEVGPHYRTMQPLVDQFRAVSDRLFAVPKEGDSAAAAGDSARAGVGAGPGDVATLVDRSGGGARGAAGPGDGGVQPGGAVRGGAGGEAAGVRASAGPDEGAAGRGAEGVRDGGGGAERVGDVDAPSASLTTQLGNAISQRRTEAVLTQIKDRFAANLAKYTGDPTKVPEYLRELEAVKKLPPEARAALRHAKPQGPVDVGLNLTKIPLEGMSDEQKEQLGLALLFRNHMLSRAKPMTEADVRGAMQKILETTTPEEFLDMAKMKGLRDPADFALLETLASTFGREVDAGRAQLRVAQIDAAAARDKGDSLAIKNADEMVQLATDKIAHALLRRDEAIFTLIPESTRVARAMAFRRMMFHPLTAEETFKSRFFGAMRASGIAKGKQDEFWKMLSDTVAQGPTADWTQFTNAFREATQPKKFDKFLEFWKAGLLGWPTQFVNIGTNLAFLGLRNSEHAVSSLASTFFSGLTGKPKERFVGESAARMTGGRYGMAEAWEGLKHDMKDIASLRPPDPRRRLEMGTFFDDPNFRQLYGAIEGKKGEFVRIPFKVLDAFDNFFKHIIRNQEWAAQAHRLSQSQSSWSHANEGSSHATARIFDEIRRVARDPISNQHLWRKEGYQKAIQAGRDASVQDTFQEALIGNPMRQAVGSYHRATNQLPVLQLLTPFQKTPYNILAEAMKRTPVAAAWAIKKYLRGEIDDVRFVEDMVKGGIGTAVMATMFELALNDQVTGSGPADPKEVEILKRTGWQPRSIKLGDNYYSYQRLAPFSIPLGIAADMAEAYKKKDTDTATELLQKGVVSISDNVFDQSFISGLDSWMKIITDPQRQGLTAIRQLQASLIPNVVGVVPVGHAARAIDPTYRETEAFSFSPAQAQVPFASMLLPAQRGPSGEVRQRKGTAAERLLSPIMRSPVETGPVAEAAAEISRVGPTISSPPPYFKVGDEKVYYTESEREAIAQAQEKGFAKAAALIKTGAYQRLPDRQTVESGKVRTKRDAILEVIERYRQPVTERINKQALRRARRGDI